MSFETSLGEDFGSLSTLGKGCRSLRLMSWNSWNSQLELCAHIWRCRRPQSQSFPVGWYQGTWQLHTRISDREGKAVEMEVQRNPSSVGLTRKCEEEEGGRREEGGEHRGVHPSLLFWSHSIKPNISVFSVHDENDLTWTSDWKWNIRKIKMPKTLRRFFPLPQTHLLPLKS